MVLETLKRRRSNGGRGGRRRRRRLVARYSPAGRRGNKGTTKERIGHHVRKTNLPAAQRWPGLHCTYEQAPYAPRTSSSAVLVAAARSKKGLLNVVASALRACGELSYLWIRSRAKKEIREDFISSFAK
ncbi:hypothetical protein E2C01_069943 [Portunus trituberculatus]|uniref:Uncharacterized protein n=1 Tax=Portunus trituberculatus TaxID=210409 RepID=A0A5B7HZX5_PORTR|nr:hypothetical protein [Portunus trituberculatus]